MRTRHAAARPRKWPLVRDALLEEAILHLRHLKSALIVAIAALRRQNCDLDEDIATLLQRCVCDSLEEQLERLEAARHPVAARLRCP
jgi:hypothetical protein